MFDIWSGDVELTSLTIWLSILVVFPGQLLLCFRVRRRWLRLIPAVVLGGLGLACAIPAAIITGWDGLGYLILAILFGIALGADILAWIAWAVTRWIKKRRNL